MERCPKTSQHTVSSSCKWLGLLRGGLVDPHTLCENREKNISLVITGPYLLIRQRNCGHWDGPNSCVFTCGALTPAALSPHLRSSRARSQSWRPTEACHKDLPRLFHSVRPVPPVVHVIGWYWNGNPPWECRQGVVTKETIANKKLFSSPGRGSRCSYMIWAIMLCRCWKHRHQPEPEKTSTNPLWNKDASKPVPNAFSLVDK